VESDEESGQNMESNPILDDAKPATVVALTFTVDYGNNKFMPNRLKYRTTIITRGKMKMNQLLMDLQVLSIKVPQNNL